MRKVITYGTFDTLHHGHIRLLRRARALGDYLIVALSTDEFNLGKGKSALFSYEERKDDLEAIRYVDMVIPEHTWDQKKPLTLRISRSMCSPSVMIGRGKFDFLKPQCEVVYLERTPLISSTQIRNQIIAQA